MTIPANLTHAEAGAFLVAVGQHMVDHDVCADAVLAPDMLKNDDYAWYLVDDMRRTESYQDMSIDRALEIINNLTLAEAIEFVQLPKGA